MQIAFFYYLQLGLDKKEFKELINIILKEHREDLLGLINTNCVYAHTHEYLSTLEGFLKKQFNEDFEGEIL